MALSAPVEREPLHTRSYEFSGYQRADGLWDIEGHLTDVKTYAFMNEFRGEIAPGTPIHDMWIRLTIDEDFLVRDIEAITDQSPFAVCPEITPNFRKIIGAKIGPGWRAHVRKELGGTQGCTHLTEMLGAMATVAFQTLYPVLVKKRPPRPAGKRPALLDSCYAFRSDGDIARKEWPEFFSGD